MRATGRFISFEGVDGSGKSTQAALLAQALEERGERVVRTREPGGTPLGEALRGVLLATDAASIGPLAEMHLFAAARAQLVSEVIGPALAGGAWVVADRFVDSSLAYQGVARSLGVTEVLAANMAAVDHHLPALTVVLTMGTEEAAGRRGGQPADRIENEGELLQRRVAEGYRELLDRFPVRLRGVDASGTPTDVHARVWAAVRALPEGAGL
ncbi:MAG: dTMP kinase [Miltoncostaeaceae bacterium]